MKILFFSILSFLSIFLFAQNQFPISGTNQTAIIDGTLPYNGKLNLINNSRMTVESGSDIVMNQGAMLFSTDVFVTPIDINQAYVRLKNGFTDFHMNLGGISGLNFGFAQYKNNLSEYPSLSPISGIGFMNSDILPKRLYLTHGSTPWNSTFGINILPNGDTGIGTISPTTKLEIKTANTLDPNNYGDSGLRLTNLTSNNNSISGAAPIGVDATGKVVRVEGGGSSDRGWLTIGNIGTTASTATFGNDVNNNFLGTTDNQPLVIATNNKERLRITASGRLIFHNNPNYTSPNNLNNLYLGGGNETLHVNATNNSANTVVGMGTLKVNTTGYKNTAIGSNLLYKNTTGNQNAVVGSNSMINNTTGSQNVVVGSNSMNAATTSTQNVVVGNNALTTVTTTGNYNVAVGNGSLNKTTTGQYNIHLGYYNAESSVTTGTRNIGIGYNAGKNLTTGSNNIIIGSENLPNIVLNAPISATENNQLNIGNWIYGYNGQIAIGSFTTPLSTVFTNNPEYQLIVKNGIKTEKVRVELAIANSWPDYVFEKDYKLMPIEELTSFITLNKHLPNIPNAEEIKKDGIDLGQMDGKLLEKIEELTLYNIDLYKESKILKEENNSLKEENEQQQKLLNDLLKRVEKLESNK